jgi:hypothetical protein
MLYMMRIYNKISLFWSSLKLLNFGLVFLLITLAISPFLSSAQNTVTINSTGAAGSLSSGHVRGDTYAKSDGQINVKEDSGGGQPRSLRGWARFNLSSIPAGATITSVSLQITQITTSNSTIANAIKGFAGDPSVLTGENLYLGIGASNAGTIYWSGAWGTGTLTLSLNTTAIQDVQSAIGNFFNVGLVRGLANGSNQYNFHGYDATAANQPKLIIQYTCPTLSITTQPASQSKCAGDNASFSVTASGGLAPLTYQWRLDGNPISGATASTYSISSVSSANAGNYTVVITDACGQSVTSNTASLSVTAAPTCATNLMPVNGATIAAGSTTLSWSAVPGAISYDVYFEAGNSTPAFYSNVTTTSVTPPATVSGTTYHWKVVPINSCNVQATGCVVSSFTAITATCSAPSLGSVANAAVCAGSNTTLSISGSCIVGALNLQWRKNGVSITNGASGTGSAYSGATSTTLSITNASAADAGNYDVVAVCDCGSMPSGTSNLAVLTVNSLPTVSASASPAGHCITPAQSTLTATGASTYSWSPSMGLSSATGSSVTATVNSSATYSVTGTDANGCIGSSNVSINVNSATTLWSEDFNACPTNQILPNSPTANSCGWTMLNITANNKFYIGIGTATCAVNGTPFLGLATHNSFTCGYTAGSETNIIAYKTTGFSTVGFSGLSLKFNWRGSTVDPQNDYIQVVYNTAGTPGVASSWIDLPGASFAGQASAQAASITLPASLEGLSNVFIGFRWLNDNVNGANPGVSIDDVLVTGFLSPSVTIAASQTAICQGASVTFTATSTNAGSNPSFAWKVNGQPAGTNSSTFTTTTLSDGDLVRVEMSTSVACVTNPNPSSNVITMVVQPPTAVTTQPVSVSQCPGTTANFSVVASGLGTLSYQWKLGTTNVGGNSATLILTNISAADVGSYTVEVTGQCGTATSQAATLSLEAVPSVTASASDNTLCIGEQVTLTGDGAITYSWNNSVTDGMAFGPVATETYTVTGTGSNGCTNTATVTVTVNQLPVVVANASSLEVCDGSAVTLTGSGAVAYNWNHNVSDGISFIPATVETYTVTGTDVNGCENIDSVTVIINTLPLVTATASTDSICAGDAITLTGAGADTYVWDNGAVDGISFNPSATTVYTVTGTDVNGCENTATVEVAIFETTIVANASAAAVCPGTAVTLTGSGGLSYTWDNNIGDGIPFVPATTETYTVTGTDMNGCESSASVTVSIYTLPVVTANVSVAAVCPGTSVIFTGGGAQNYSWNNGVVNGQPFTPVATQSYTVTGTDANGCQNTATVTVTVNPVPTVTANASATAVCKGGPVTLSGAGAQNYTWSNNVLNGVAFTPISTTTYTVTGTNAQGCTGTAQIAVTVNDLPSVSLSNDTACVYDKPFDLYKGIPSGGVYSNSTGTITSVNPSTIGMGLHPVTYTYTDANQCTASASAFIVISACTGVEALAGNSHGVKVFPNPAHHKFTVEIMAPIAEEAIVEIIDSKGQSVITKKINLNYGSNALEVDVMSLSRGIYIIRTLSSGSTNSQRVVLY